MEKSYRYWRDHLDSAISELDNIYHVIMTEKNVDYVSVSKKYIRNVFCDCLEMLYKSIKFILISDGVNLSQDSPKYIFREGLRQSFYSETDTENLIKCVDLRNTIVHEYDMYQRTEEDLRKIFSFKSTLDIVSDIIKNELEIREEEY